MSENPNSRRNTVLFDQATRDRLEALQKQYGLSFSDASRRGIEMLYNYLILDKLPDGKDAKAVIASLVKLGVANELRVKTLFEEAERKSREADALEKAT